MKNNKKELWKKIVSEVSYSDAIVFFNGILEGVGTDLASCSYSEARMSLIDKREARRKAQKIKNLYDYSPKARYIIKKFGVHPSYGSLPTALKTKVKKLKKLKDIDELNEYLLQVEKSELLKEIDNTEDGWGISRILSKYYDKDIKLDFGLNKPNITKQLDKFDIEPTQRESQAIDELLKLMENMKTALYLVEDNKLPFTYDDRKDWALSGSCHCPGGVGEYTSFALKAMDDFYMLKFNDKNDLPTLRVYYRNDGDLGHAGLYADSNLSKYNHTSYQATSLLLSVFVDDNYKVDDFSIVDGIPEDMIPHNIANVWCNMHERSDYKKYGTVSDIFSGLYGIDEDEFYSDTGVKIYYDGWNWTDEIVICEHCEECLPEGGAVYSPRMELYFCSNDCVLDYALDL